MTSMSLGADAQEVKANVLEFIEEVWLRGRSG